MLTLCGFAVSNYYNKLKLVLLEKGVPFEERLVYPWQRDRFQGMSPMWKIPFIETEHGGLSESQAILEYIEERYPERPLYPQQPYQRAKCRELIQHLELNCEWVIRRTYKESVFGGRVSDETKREASERLTLGLEAVSQLSSFTPYILGTNFSAADCAAYVHLLMIRLSTERLCGANPLDTHFPRLAAYMQLMESRPHVQRMLVERERAMAAFVATNVKYEG